jgi:hypothetical protein
VTTDENGCPHGAGPDDDCTACASEAMCAATPGRKFEKESEEAWNAAVDWLINSRHTGDPTIQDAFWGIVDGRYSVEGADKR